MSDNPFLLPPGGGSGGRHSGSSEPAESAPGVTRQSGDPARYIAVPADLESGTFKVPRREPAALAEQAAPVEKAEPVVEAEPVAEETRLDPLIAPAIDRAWRLVLPDGAAVPLEGTLLLGRDPAALPEFPGAALVAVDDPGRTVSKTHAAVVLRDGAVRVRDLYSTNGTTVTSTTLRIRIEPGDEIAIPVEAAGVELGSFVVRIEASSESAGEHPGTRADIP